MDVLEWFGPGRFFTEIVGEAFYQQVISDFVGGKTEDGHEAVVDVLLVLEDTNPHDSKAVAVVLGTCVCGYLDRREARKHRSRLVKIGQAEAVIKCKAKIVGGWDRGPDDQGHFGVRLDLPKKVKGV